MKPSLVQAIRAKYGEVHPPAQTPTPVQEVKAVQAPAQSPIITDLSDLIRRPRPVEPEITPEEETTTESENKATTETTAPEAEQEPAELIEESVQGVKNVVEGMLGQAIENSSDLAEIVLVGITMLRQHIIYPWASMKFVFSPADQERLTIVVPKYVDFAAMGKSSDAVPIKADAVYETEEDKELMYRFSQYQKHRKSVPYKPSEEKLIKAVIEKKLQGVSVGDFIAKYDWVLALLFIEGSRIFPLIGMRKYNPLSQFD